MLSHTVSSTKWHNLRFNGTLVGEVGINAALCGTWGTPVALVTGDDVVCAESSELLGPGLKTLAVKQGLGRFSARHLSPARARELLEAAARDALADVASAPVYDPGAPCTIEVELAHARPRRRLPPPRGRRAASTPAPSAPRRPRWWDAWRAIYL